MIILQAKTKQGKSKELIKRFIMDKKSATLITDELSLNDIYGIIKLLDYEGYDISNKEMKNIETMQFTNCNADYYKMIQDRFTENLYLDVHIPKDVFKDIKKFCKDLEREYGGTITIVEQLSTNSNIEGINVVVEE